MAAWSNWSYRIHNQETENYDCMGPLNSLSLFVQIRISARAWYHPQQMSLPASIKTIEIIPYRQGQTIISWVLIGFLNLTSNTNHPPPSRCVSSSSTSLGGPLWPLWFRKMWWILFFLDRVLSGPALDASLLDSKHFCKLFIEWTLMFGPLMLQIYSLPWILTILPDVLVLSMLEIAINSF